MELSFEEHYNRFKDKKVLVLGDVMLDAYLKGNSTRLCPEAAAPVVDVQCCDYVPGGAANVAVNLAALGADVTCMGITGRDADAEKLTSIMHAHNIRAFLIPVAERRTICKTRLMAGHQVIARFDTGSEEFILPSTARELIEQLDVVYSMYDAIVLADYRKGVFTSGVIAALLRLQRQHKRFLVVDARNLSLYKRLHPNLVKPNRKEAAALLNMSLSVAMNAESFRESGRELYAATGAEINALTLDEDGAFIFQKDQLLTHIPADKIEHPQVSGAGDTYISAFALALLGQATPDVAGFFAAKAAAVSVSREGTATCSIHDVLASIAADNKLVASPEMLERLGNLYRSSGKKIVFTNGCFDILHSGHVNYLRQAARLGDILIVGINTDESIRRLKGEHRPVNSLQERMQVLAGLSVVAHVIPFGSETDDTPVELIKQLKPHLFVKGGDYSKEQLPEAPVVEALGGVVQLLPFTEGRSTSAVIQKISNLKVVKHA
jgi:D-beta-D-heptose 7-phosphate kinase/D-beta-D-heptose 1-phosphate adenosyltransferase